MRSGLKVGMPSKAAKLNRQTARKIIIVAYDDAKLMDIVGPLQAFSDARFEDGRPAYQLEVVSESGGLIVTDIPTEAAQAKRSNSSTRSTWRRLAKPLWQVNAALRV
jgi:hypothetical protein